mgnify:FL=1
MKELFEELLNKVDIAYSIASRKGNGATIHKLGNKVLSIRSMCHNLIDDWNEDWFMECQQEEYGKHKYTLEKVEKRIATSIARVEDFEKWCNTL